jgi:hypothetical protein
MHEDALDAVDGLPFQMIDGLRALAKVAAAAELQPTNVGRNLHAKNRARFVTETAAEVYTRLTGKAVKRVSKTVPISEHRTGVREAGEFFNFLTSTFEQLHIKARAAGQLQMLYVKSSAKNRVQIT